MAEMKDVASNCFSQNTWKVLALSHLNACVDMTSGDTHFPCLSAN